MGLWCQKNEAYSPVKHCSFFFLIIFLAHKGIVGFAVRRETCLGCKGALQATERTVCKSCKVRLTKESTLPLAIFF